MRMQVKLFGDLRKTVEPEISGGAPVILQLDTPKIKQVSDIIALLHLTEEAVSHIFVNSQYAGLKKSISDGDIVALFPKNMGLLYKWYFTREEDG